MLNDTTDNIFTFFDYPSALKKAISTSNATLHLMLNLNVKQGKELYPI